MATTGVIGHEWRADVTATGAVEPWDGSPPVEWHVAADDRWHDTRTERGVRHRCVEGVAVFETKMRIPGGDAVQRVWSVADGGGHTLIEVANDSPSPMAVAFTRADLLTSRPPADIPIAGIELPAGSFVMPVGHRSSVTVALAHRATAGAALPRAMPPADAVVRGWIGRTDAASRLVLPDVASSEAVRTARCEVALVGPGDAEADPARFLVGAAELVRMGEWDERAAGAASLEVALAAETVAGDAERGSWLAVMALDAAGVVLACARERRALRDLQRLQESRPAGIDRARPGIGVRSRTGAVGVDVVPAVEGELTRGSSLFPAGIPRRWFGHDFEAHGLVVGPSSRLSLAVRWHGPNAAVLWECDGDPVRLSTSAATGGWASAQPSGEALWQLAAPAVSPS